MPIVETTPQNPINPYGKAKKMAEVAIHDWAAANPKAAGIVILRYFNVIGSDPKGRVGEAPRPDLRKHSRISGEESVQRVISLGKHGYSFFF